MFHFIFEVLPLLSSNGIVSEAFAVRVISIKAKINFILKHYTRFTKYKYKGGIILFSEKCLINFDILNKVNNY